MGVTFSQFFPPAPTLTETNLPSQKGKVFIVTGGYSGVGFELCSILYHASGTVYLAGRSESQALTAISRIKSQLTDASGSLHFLQLSLDDLSSVKAAVQAFCAAETRLDILFNNAGVSCPPPGSVSAQGTELQLATNCLGHHLLTQLLLPTLRTTATTAGPGAARVVWTSSIVVDLQAPNAGIELRDLEAVPSNQQRSYANSKVGNWFLAHALAAQAGEGKGGILSVTQNPGNMKTGLLRHMPSIVRIVTAPLLYGPRMGAYTNLWAGLSEELTLADGGAYVLPWGRKHPAPRPELLAAMQTKEEGGMGVAKEFVEWCDAKIADYL